MNIYIEHTNSMIVLPNSDSNYVCSNSVPFVYVPSKLKLFPVAFSFSDVMSKNSSKQGEDSNLVPLESQGFPH